MLILSIVFYFYFVTLPLSPTALLAAGQNDWGTSRHLTQIVRVQITGKERNTTTLKEPERRHGVPPSGGGALLNTMCQLLCALDIVATQPAEAGTPNPKRETHN